MTVQSKSSRVQQNYRLDVPTREALRIIGQIEKRSMAQIIERAVEEYYLKHYNFLEKQRQKDDKK